MQSEQRRCGSIAGYINRWCSLWCCTKRGCHKCHCTLCTIFVYIACIGGIIPVTGFSLFNWRARSPFILKPEWRGIDASSVRRVHFTSVDGDYNLNVVISGLHFKARTPDKCEESYAAKSYLRYNFPANANATVVAVHGIGSCALCSDEARSLLDFAVKPLLCTGFNVLAIDMRNHGKSSNAGPVTAGYREGRDVLAAIHWLRHNQSISPHRIFLWGMSLGGAAVGYAASQCPLCRAVALEAPPVSTAMVYGGFLKGYPSWINWWTAFWHKTFMLSDPYSESLLKEVRSISANVLHSHGSEDQVVPVANAYALQTMMEARGPVIDGLTGQVRRAKYKTFFHRGYHISSWSFPPYYELMLKLFSEAANDTAGMTLDGDDDDGDRPILQPHVLQYPETIAI